MQDLTVMVLEDEPFQRLVTVTALEKALQGRILQAADGDEGIAILTAYGSVDIVLCDLKVTGTDGLAFLRYASSSGKVGAVALCSELAPELRQATISMIHCLGMNFLGDLEKPFKLEGFRLLVKRYREYCRSTPVVLPTTELPPLRDVLCGLDNGEFEAYYQPKVTLDGQRLVGAEVLARWTHPQWGVLAPAHFLPVMEQHDLIDRVFWQLFHQGLALLRKLIAKGKLISLAFNLHPAQLASSELTGRIAEALKKSQVAAASVIFEIAETGIVSAPTSSLENLVRLRMLGCGLAMDDFGAGHSLLEKFSELPFSELKLDATFLRKMQSQPKNAAIISCSVALAKALGISLVIKGVENAEQRTQLVELGGTIAQGFLFARPMPESHFIDFCIEQTR
ncbi:MULTISPECIES: EAL domain-containing protein [Pseudomonas chlororaphis group]|uniref:EAL domain-containing response regulator n=1 Tax=Pseudomonas chlororaphis group TaxID=136842 RepID=UPI00209742DB|nr:MULTISPECIES: EAL domain-containing response regulator [Pseudomonas chlororaphis group]MCO7580380.1 EAL domain-containing response regulator [Pseudomonas protegens]MCO7586503.1 EAL domain-containing response regulator [Pseudomonas chlororaphis]MCO7603536.1 EAL domain-containing response regulator [Pseudomonas chlororaphis]